MKKRYAIIINLDEFDLILSALHYTANNKAYNVYKRLEKQRDNIKAVKE